MHSIENQFLMIIETLQSIVYTVYILGSRAPQGEHRNITRILALFPGRPHPHTHYVLWVHVHVGLDKLCFFSALLFYSPILSINAYYALKLSYYSQNYASIICQHYSSYYPFSVLVLQHNTLYRSIIIPLTMTVVDYG